MKFVVVGLDGANWRLIEPWIEAGELPNLKYLRENGCWSDSKSQLPAVSCPNWKCYSTGKNPAKLGVYWWQRVDKSRMDLVGYNSNSFDSPEIFEYIGEEGLRVGVINMPTTYPPRKINGFMVSGAPDSAYSGFTHPPEFEKELQKLNYKVYPSVHIASSEDILNYPEEIQSIINSRFDLALNMLDKVDFLHITVFYINVLHHFLYNHPLVKEAWKLIDSRIGEFINHKDVEYIFLMSDHGTNEIYETFYVNTWLEKEGYLKTKKTFSKKLQKSGITKQNLVKIANKLRLANLVRRTFPERIIRSVPSEDGTISGTRVLSTHVNWKESNAISVGQGLIYLLVDKESDEYELIREDIIGKIEKLTTIGGYKVAKNAYKKEEVYNGKHLDTAPDVVYEEAPHIYTSSGIGSVNIFGAPKKWRAENCLEGIFLAYGNGIERGVKLNGISILDIAPTILYIMGAPIPNDIDGRVLKEIFERDSELSKGEIRYAEVNREKELLNKRIRELKGLQKL